VLSRLRNAPAADHLTPLPHLSVFPLLPMAPANIWRVQGPPNLDGSRAIITWTVKDGEVAADFAPAALIVPPVEYMPLAGHSGERTSGQRTSSWEDSLRYIYCGSAGTAAPVPTDVTPGMDENCGRYYLVKRATALDTSLKADN
jgi:hypothetical protein